MIDELQTLGFSVAVAGQLKIEEDLDVPGGLIGVWKILGGTAWYMLPGGITYFAGQRTGKGKVKPINKVPPELHDGGVGLDPATNPFIPGPTE